MAAADLRKGQKLADASIFNGNVLWREGLVCVTGEVDQFDALMLNVHNAEALESNAPKLNREVDMSYQSVCAHCGTIMYTTEQNYAIVYAKRHLAKHTAAASE